MHLSFEWKSAVEPTFNGRGEFILFDGHPLVKATFATASKIPLLYSDTRQYTLNTNCAGDRLTLMSSIGDSPQMICTITSGSISSKGWYASVRPMDCGTMSFANNDAVIDAFGLISRNMQKNTSDASAQVIV